MLEHYLERGVSKAELSRRFGEAQVAFVTAHPDCDDVAFKRSASALA